MKKILIILLLIPVVCFSQKTKINIDQIKDEVLRPQSGGVLADPWEVQFDVPYKQHTLTVDEDIELSLAASGNVANSDIDIIATGDGTHNLTFAEDWEIEGDNIFDANKNNRIHLHWNGFWVEAEVKSQKGIDLLETELLSAIVTNEVPTELNLLFNEAVNITSNGWSVDASAGAVTIGNVTGSGTTSAVFTLSRAILYSETVTVSYSTPVNVSGTTDLAGFELAESVDFPVTVPDPPPAPVQDCDITVCASGCDFTTITAANAAAAADDVICIGNGTYREMITVADNGVTFTAMTGETPIISGFTIIPNT